MQPSAGNSTVLTLEVDVTRIPPEGVTDRQAFVGTDVSRVVFEKISVTALLFRLSCQRRCSRPRAPDQTGERVDLLDERRRLHEPHAIGDDELELLWSPVRPHRRSGSCQAHID